MHAPFVYITRCVLLAMLVSAGCGDAGWSPCGQFRAQVDAGPGTAANSRCHVLSLYDRTEQLMYRDPASSFVSYLRVYTAWDAASRWWLYSSDNGNLFVWERISDQWLKAQWHQGPSSDLKMLGEPGWSDLIWCLDSTGANYQLFERTNRGWVESKFHQVRNASSFAPPAGLKPAKHK